MAFSDQCPFLSSPIGDIVFASVSLELDEGQALLV